MKSIIRSIAILGIFLICVARSAIAQEIPELSQMKEAAESTGKIALRDVEVFRNSFLSDVSIASPKFSRNGSVTGTTSFGGRDAPVLLQYVSGNQLSSRWLLAIKLPTDRLRDVAPDLHQALANNLSVSTPIMVFCKQSFKVQSSQLDENVRQFYREAFANDDFELQLSDGVNLLATASAETSLQSSAGMLGIDLESLDLQGVILKNFDADELKQAKQNGKLLTALGREAQLRGRLTNLTIKGLPEEFQISDLAILVTGQPSVALEFYMTVGAGKDQRDFQCLCNFSSDKKSQALSISAKSDVNQPWANALGIQGLEMSDITMEIRYQKRGAAPPSTLVGVTGKMQFGKKLVAVTGGVQSRAAGMSGFFRGSINTVNRDDLVQFVNKMHAASGGGSAAINAQGLPDFEIRNAVLNFAPMGGSEELGIESGVGFKGQLAMNGSPIARVDVFADVQRPLLKIKADINQFKLGDIELKQCKLDVQMADVDSYFRLKAGAKVIDIEASAEAELAASSSVIRMSGKIANAFDANVTLRTTTLDNPSWEFDAKFKDDFSKNLGASVANDLRDWAETTKSNFDKAAGDLEKAKRDVNRINADIARMRGQVESERKRHQAGLANAQRDLQKINQDIERMRQTVQGERNRHLAAIRTAEQKVQSLDSDINKRRNVVKANRTRDLSANKRDMDNAKRSYDKAQSAYTSARNSWKKEKNRFKKIKKGITKDAKGVARDARKVIYIAAKKKYDIARAALNKIPVDADPAIIALNASKSTAGAALQQVRRRYQDVTRGISIDADPRVAALFVGRDTARVAVGAAQQALTQAHRLPVEADPRIAGMVAARETANASLTAAKLAVNTTGDAVNLATQILAAAAEGKLIAVNEINLRGRVDAYDSGGKLELNAKVTILNKPEIVRVALTTGTLQKDKLLATVGEAIASKAKRIAGS